MTIIADERIIQLVQDMDNALNEWSAQEELSPLNLSAMLLARLYHFNKAVGSEETYKDLLVTASNENFEHKEH